MENKPDRQTDRQILIDPPSLPDPPLQLSVSIHPRAHTHNTRRHTALSRAGTDCRPSLRVTRETMRTICWWLVENVLLPHSDKELGAYSPGCDREGCYITLHLSLWTFRRSTNFGETRPQCGTRWESGVQQVSADCRTWKPKEVTAGKVGSENYLFLHPGAFWIESSGLKSHRRVNYLLFFTFFFFFTVTMYGPLLLQMSMVLFLGTVSEVAVAQVSSARVMRGNFRRDGEVISWMTLFIVVLMGGH